MNHSRWMTGLALCGLLAAAARSEQGPQTLEGAVTAGLQLAKSSAIGQTAASPGAANCAAHDHPCAGGGEPAPLEGACGIDPAGSNQFAGFVRNNTQETYFFSIVRIRFYVKNPHNCCPCDDEMLSNRTEYVYATLINRTISPGETLAVSGTHHLAAGQTCKVVIEGVKKQ